MKLVGSILYGRGASSVASKAQYYVYFMAQASLLVLQNIYISQESLEAIFRPAEKEVAKMLAENLLNKFKATAAYKEIIGAMELEAN